MLNAEKYKNFFSRYGRNFGISKKAEVPFVCENHLFTFMQKDCRNCKWRYEWDCDNLNEEIADVSICIGALVQMKYADVKEENNYYEKKLERLLNRAKEKEFENSEWDG